MITSLQQTNQPPPDAPSDSSGHQPEAWSAVFVLALVFDDSASMYGAVAEEIGASLLNFHGRAALCLRVEGPMDVALAEAVDTVTSAMSDSGLPFNVVETRMVSVNDALDKVDSEAPVSFYTVTQCAAALGVSAQRARQLLKVEQLPSPDAFAGDSPLWESASFERFAAQRKALLERMPPGLNWRFTSNSKGHRAKAAFPTRPDDTAVLPGGRKASLKEVLALREQLAANH